MKIENIKLNYFELVRLNDCDRRTIKKYNEGYEGKSLNRNKESKLDKYKENIKIKLELPGATIKGTYEYLKNNDVRIDISVMDFLSFKPSSIFFYLHKISDNNYLSF